MNKARRESSEEVNGMRFDDPAFTIQWPLVASVVYDQDRNWPLEEQVGGTKTT